MSGDALPGSFSRPPTSTSQQPGSVTLAELFASVLVGIRPQDLDASTRALARWAPAEARRVSQAARADAPDEVILGLELLYGALKDDVRAHATSAEPSIASSAPRWKQALAALRTLRHRQRAALAAHLCCGLPIDATARIIGVPERDARSIIESGVARVVESLGSPTDARRALRTAGARLAVSSEAQDDADEALDGVAAGDPARLPRSVVRTLLGPPLVTGDPSVEEVAADDVALSNPSEVSRGRHRPSAVEALLAPLPSRPAEEGGPPRYASPTPPRRAGRGAPPRDAEGASEVPRDGRPRRRRIGWLVAALAALLAFVAVPAVGGATDSDPRVTPSAAVDPSGATTPAPRAAPSRTEPSVSPVATRDPAWVVVRRGDSLWRIADRVLGDARRWPELWRANRGERMTKAARFTDPHLIRPGWRLEIPPAAVRSSSASRSPAGA